MGYGCGGVCRGSGVRVSRRRSAAPAQSARVGRGRVAVSVSCSKTKMTAGMPAVGARVRDGRGSRAAVRSLPLCPRPQNSARKPKIDPATPRRAPSSHSQRLLCWQPQPPISCYHQLHCTQFNDALQESTCPVRARRRPTMHCAGSGRLVGPFRAGSDPFICIRLSRVCAEIRLHRICVCADSVAHIGNHGKRCSAYWNQGMGGIGRWISHDSECSLGWGLGKYPRQQAAILAG